MIRYISLIAFLFNLSHTITASETFFPFPSHHVTSSMTSGSLFHDSVSITNANLQGQSPSPVGIANAMSPQTIVFDEPVSLANVSLHGPVPSPVGVAESPTFGMSPLQLPSPQLHVCISPSELVEETDVNQNKVIFVSSLNIGSGVQIMIPIERRAKHQSKNYQDILVSFTPPSAPYAIPNKPAFLAHGFDKNSVWHAPRSKNVAKNVGATAKITK